MVEVPEALAEGLETRRPSAETLHRDMRWASSTGQHVVVVESRAHHDPAEMPYVYLLECSDGSFYIGSTRHLERRLFEHNEGIGAAYTRRRRPVRLAWHAWYDSVAEAYAMEK